MSEICSEDGAEHRKGSLEGVPCGTIHILVTRIYDQCISAPNKCISAPYSQSDGALLLRQLDKRVSARGEWEWQRLRHGGRVSDKAAK